MDKWALYFVAIGIVLIAAGAWTYQTAQPYLALDEIMVPATCPDGSQFLLDPAYLAAEYNVKAYAYYPGNFTVTKVVDYRLSMVIANDPCADGQAQIIIATPQGATVQPVPVAGSPEYLASYMIAAAGLLEDRPEGAADTGMGVFPARIATTSQNMMFTQYGTIENRFYTLYYDANTGLLVRQDEARQVLVALQPMPQEIYITRVLQDYGKAPGPQGELVYQGQAAELVAAYSIAGGLGVVAGLGSIAYGAWLLLYRPPEEALGEAGKEEQQAHA